MFSPFVWENDGVVLFYTIALPAVSHSFLGRHCHRCCFCCFFLLFFHVTISFSVISFIFYTRFVTCVRLSLYLKCKVYSKYYNETKSCYHMPSQRETLMDECCFRLCCYFLFSLLSWWWVRIENTFQWHANRSINFQILQLMQIIYSK